MNSTLVPTGWIENVFFPPDGSFIMVYDNDLEKGPFGFAYVEKGDEYIKENPSIKYWALISMPPEFSFTQMVHYEKK